MDRLFEPNPVWLAPNTVLRLDRARGRAISVTSGHVWITQTGNPDDTVLGPGERMLFLRRGRALVQAFEFAELQVLHAVEKRGGIGHESVLIRPAVVRDSASV